MFVCISALGIMWPGCLCFFLVVSIVYFKSFACNPVSSSFNFSIKEEDVVNSTTKTLQQENLDRYANFAPVSNTIRFKEEVPDNLLSESAYSRGLLHHDHGGYGLHGGLHDYDDGHYGYGYDYELHGINHLGGYHNHHLSHGHGLHHKHYNAAIAAKTILWPLAGLAILGTAAALVSNPVLLQLGVISGRKRRDTQEVTGPEFNFDKWNKVFPDKDEVYQADIEKESTSKVVKKFGNPKPNLKKKVEELMHGSSSKKAYQAAQSTVGSVTLGALLYNGHYNDDKRFVPIHLKVKKH